MSLPSFQQYQADFAAYIRRPKGRPRPAGVKAKGMRVYTEVVFNNFEDTLASCFPVCKSVLGVRLWKKVVKRFLAEHRCSAPWFRQIPEELLKWLETSPSFEPSLPPYFKSLAHYEWIELAIALSDAASNIQPEAEADLLSGIPLLAPALALLAYEYPVHRISPRYKPTQPEAVHLLVFRDEADKVQFVELNPVSARLLGLLGDGGHTGLKALVQIADEMQHPQPESVIEFGRQLLIQLQQQGVILGAKHH